MARVCAEIEQRMTELRPLLDEYERLLEADNALDSFEAAPAPEPTPPEPTPPEPTPPAPPAPEPEPTPRRPAPRILPAMPSLRTQSGPSALPSLSTAPAKPAPIAVEAPPAVPEPAVEEFEPEPELERKRKPASPSDVRQAILAALEHGSHTIGELVMVTAMSTPEIRANLSQLARQHKIARVKRQGDGKSAFALPTSSARA